MILILLSPAHTGDQPVAPTTGPVGADYPAASCEKFFASKPVNYPGKKVFRLDDGIYIRFNKLQLQARRLNVYYGERGIVCLYSDSGTVNAAVVYSLVFYCDVGSITISLIQV